MVRIFAFSALWYVACLAKSDAEYSNLNTSGMDCYKRSSCKVILRQPAFWLQRRDSFLARNCECDRKCMHYGDCCFDYKARMIKNQVKNKRNNIQMKCINSDSGTSFGAYAIAECPARYTGPQLTRTKCLSKNNTDDPLMSVPVTDPNTKITYKNRYCAECNEADQNLLLSWIIRINCDSSNSPGTINSSFNWDKISYNSMMDSWIVSTSQDVYQICKLEFSLPPYLYSRIRFCRPNVVSSCANDWRYSFGRENCESPVSYMAVMKATDGRLFKNPECALCNNVNVNDISCLEHVSERNEAPNSISFALDINDNHENFIGLEGNSSKNCQQQEIYDPFLKQCRNLRHFDTNS